MNRDDMKELARAERRAATKLLRRAGRVIDAKAQERLAKAAQAAQRKAIDWAPR